MAVKNDDQKRKGQGSIAAARQARLARALRANLARRKAQARARAHDKDDKGGEGKS